MLFIQFASMSNARQVFGFDLFRLCRCRKYQLGFQAAVGLYYVQILKFLSLLFIMLIKNDIRILIIFNFSRRKQAVAEPKSLLYIMQNPKKPFLLKKSTVFSVFDFNLFAKFISHFYQQKTYFL